MPSLVEVLAAQLGCEYISDMHDLEPEDRRKLYEILRRIPCALWPLREWRDALEYITGVTCAQDSGAAYKALLFYAASGEKHRADRLYRR